ncbi:hypothetical protein MASR2M78_33410 [Treponema sp.]
MTRGILIVGNESPAAKALAEAAVSRVQPALTAFFPNRFSGTAGESSPEAINERLIPLDWNPAGPVSARSLVVAAENRLGRLDEAVLVCSPLALRRRADQLAPTEIDALIDDQIKGWFFLVRELALIFRARKAGTLALVLSEVGLGAAKEDATDLFGASVAASFRALAQGLLSSSYLESYRVLGFSVTDSGDDADFASFVFKILDEANAKNSGRWHKYNKGGLFGTRRG